LLNIGDIVIYHGKGAVVVGADGGKFRIRTVSGEDKSVRDKDLEFLCRGGGASALPAEPPDASEVDCAELAELAGDEKLSFAEFAELAFGEFTPRTALAAYGMLAGGNAWFAGSASEGVVARPAAEREALLAKRNEKERQQRQRAEFIARVKSGEVLPGDLPMFRDVELVATGESENSRTLKDCGVECTPEKAHELLLKCGVWNDFRDPLPDRAQVDLSDPFLPLPELPDEERCDLTHLEAFAIDDAESHDPDDAISFSDGLLWVHVADPASVVTPGGELDNEAAERGENLYLPEKVAHMLPLAATGKFGLGLNEVSPAISFAVRIGDDGVAALEKMVLSQVRVRRFAYEDAEEVWDGATLSGARLLLEKFRARREAEGALFIRLPEVNIHVDTTAETISFAPVPVTPVRELVANAMLAAGSAVAKFASEREIPMPFALQEPPEIGERDRTLSGMYALRKACKVSRLSTVPGRHSGLALDPYVRVTSPLRRYCDLLAHQQLRRVIAGGELLSASYMEERIAAQLDGTERRRKLEKICNEYWTIVNFKRRPDWSGEAVFVHETDDGRRTFLIPEFAFEFKSRYGGKLRLGDRLTATLVAADPPFARAQFSLRAAPTGE